MKKSVLVAGFAVITSACAQSAEPTDATSSTVPTVAQDAQLLSTLNCDAAVEPHAREEFGMLERFAFKRKTYATHVDQEVTISLADEVGELTANRGFHPTVVKPLVVLDGDRRFEIATDYRNVTRVAFFDLSPESTHPDAPYVLEYVEAGNNCAPAATYVVPVPD
ncbi:MAG: hypothetical protein ABW321_26505 [Polyangiales bacterium]